MASAPHLSTSVSAVLLLTIISYSLAAGKEDNFTGNCNDSGRPGKSRKTIDLAITYFWSPELIEIIN